MKDNKRVLIAIGGNAITQEGQAGTIKEQESNIKESLGPIVNMLSEGYDLVITHGNGPQVGNSLIKQEAGKDKVPAYPLDILNAETQGSIGVLIEQALKNSLKQKNIDREVVTLVTQVQVDPKDPRFLSPTKPIGPFYSEEVLEELKKVDPVAKEATWGEDSGRGYRRVVPSPLPVDILSKKSIEKLSDEHYVVIAGGGGGIPVIDNNGQIEGVEAVIDKDFASALIAAQVKADVFMILTGVSRVMLNFGKPNQTELAQMTVKEALQHLEDGQFPKGSMGPKIEAAISYLENGGKEVIITSIDQVEAALKGQTGTKIIL